MNMPLIIGIFTLFILAILSSVTGVILRARRIRNTHFETICSQWLKRLNDEAPQLIGTIGGSPFDRALGKKLKVKGEQGSWRIAYPLDKRYQSMGFRVNVEMIVYVYSLVPGKDGAITTVFAGLTEPVKEWWSSSHHWTVFPELERKLHAKEMEFTFPPAPGNVLALKEVSS